MGKKKKKREDKKGKKKQEREEKAQDQQTGLITLPAPTQPGVTAGDTSGE